MFDRLPETRSQGTVLGRNAFTSALFAHGLLLGLVLAASLLVRVDPGADPPLPFYSTLIIEMSPRLGTDPDAGGRKKGHEPERTVRSEPEPPRTLEQPHEVEPAPLEPAPPPETIPVAAPAGPQDPDIGREDGDSDGSGSGPGQGGKPGITGVLDGKPNGLDNVMDRHDPDDEPRLITTGVEPPVLLVRVEPDYPEIARHARREGCVILEIVIGTDGRIESIRVLKSEPLLDAAARNAVQRWIYKPARQGGRTVKVYATVRVEFHLD